MLVIEKNDETIAVIKGKVYHITYTGATKDMTELFKSRHYPDCTDAYQQVFEETEAYAKRTEEQDTKLMLDYARTGTRYAVHRLLFEHGYPAVHHWYIDNQTTSLPCDSKVKPDMAAIARWGCAEVQDRLVNHKKDKVRKAVAEYGQEHHREALLNDRYIDALVAIIENGTKEQVTKVYDIVKSNKASERTMRWIASYAVRHGDDDLRTVILNDFKYAPVIMSGVAVHGNDSHRDELVDYKDSNIRVSVAALGSDQHRDRLLADKEPKVRATVARFGNQVQKFLLLQDADESVRNQASLPVFGRLVREQRQ